MIRRIKTKKKKTGIDDERLIYETKKYDCITEKIHNTSVIGRMAVCYKVF